MRLVQNCKRWKVKLFIALVGAGTFAHGALTFKDGQLFAQTEPGGGAPPPVPVPAPEAGPDVELPPPEDNVPPPAPPASGGQPMTEMEEPPADHGVPPMDSSRAQPGDSGPRKPSIGQPKAPPTNRGAIPGATTGSQPKTPGSKGSASKDKAKNAERITEDKVGADLVPDGQELVNIDFPEPTEIKDIIRAVSLWTGKNVLLGRDVAGKVQMISPRKVTKVEAYQAFLSALNLLGLTTVETGKVIKVVPVRSAVKSNLKTFLGSSWTPMTDEFITQIVPLKYINAQEIQTTLSRIVSSNSMIAYKPTNTLIISDSGFKVRRILDIIELLDVQTQQPKVSIVPIRYGDAKAISTMVQDIFKAQSGANKGASSYLTYKIMTDERTNSVIIFGPPRTIADVKELVRKFDVRQDDPSRQSTIYVRPLDYADAKKLAATLSSLAQGGKTGAARRPPMLQPAPPGAPGGPVDSSPDVAVLDNDVKITADESSNSLLITGSRAAYEALNTIVRKLDTRKSQVFVEAEILDINVDNGFKFGTSVFAGAKSGGANSAITWQSQALAPLVVSQTADATDQASKTAAVAPFAEDFNVGILSGTQVEIPGLGKFSPGALIKMIKSDGNTKVLSSPHILTSNNETAKIAVGQKLFFKGGTEVATSGTAVQSVKDIDVDLSLELKPNISHSNYVTMKIDLDASSGAVSSETGLPSVNKRKTSQIVTVKNGQTVVVSGLVKIDEYETYKKIPLLGDIPIIGWLFRNSDIKKSKQNLAIFLTPYIVHGANDLAAIYSKKIEERDELLSKMYGSSFKEDEFYQRLPTREDGAYKADAFDLIDEKRKGEQDRELMRDLGYEREEVKSIQGNKAEAPSTDTPASEVTPEASPDDKGGDEERSNYSDDDNASNKKTSIKSDSGIQIEVAKPEQG